MEKVTKKQSSKETRFPRKFIPCKSSGPGEEERGLAYAEMLNSPEVAACRIIGMMQPKSISDEVDIPSLIESLRLDTTAVQNGDLSSAEGMLINQALALQALFVRLSERAIKQTHMPNLEAFMRLALKSQSQCRATLETLSVIKNPPVIYAKQANVTTGPQQINNSLEAPSQARKIQNVPNQLSGASDELHTDARASRLEIKANSTLETLGKVDRPQDH